MTRELIKTIEDLNPGQYKSRLLPFERARRIVKCSVYPEGKSIPYGWMLAVDSDLYSTVEQKIRANVTVNDLLNEMKKS